MAAIGASVGILNAWFRTRSKRRMSDSEAGAQLRDDLLKQAATHHKEYEDMRAEAGRWRSRCEEIMRWAATMKATVSVMLVELSLLHNGSVDHAKAAELEKRVKEFLDKSLPTWDD
jgi:hypothetical protein